MVWSVTVDVRGSGVLSEGVKPAPAPLATVFEVGWSRSTPVSSPATTMRHPTALARAPGRGRDRGSRLGLASPGSAPACAWAHANAGFCPTGLGGPRLHRSSDRGRAGHDGNPFTIHGDSGAPGAVLSTRPELPDASFACRPQPLKHQPTAAWPVQFRDPAAGSPHMVTISESTWLDLWIEERVERRLDRAGDPQGRRHSHESPRAEEDGSTAPVTKASSVPGVSFHCTCRSVNLQSPWQCHGASFLTAAAGWRRHEVLLAVDRSVFGLDRSGRFRVRGIDRASLVAWSTREGFMARSNSRLALLASTTW